VYIFQTWSVLLSEQARLKRASSLSTAMILAAGASFRTRQRAARPTLPNPMTSTVPAEGTKRSTFKGRKKKEG